MPQYHATVPSSHPEPHSQPQQQPALALFVRLGLLCAHTLTPLPQLQIPELRDALCYAVACPACMTLELAHGCREYVTSILNGTDVVPSFCAGSVDVLREHVVASTWFADMQRDVRCGPPLRFHDCSGWIQS